MQTNKFNELELQLSHIVDVVCLTMNITQMDFLSARRGAPLPDARCIASLLAKEYTPASYSHMGRRFNRDHSTVMQQLKRAEQNKDKLFQQRLKMAREWLENV